MGVAAVGTVVVREAATPEEVAREPPAEVAPPGEAVGEEAWRAEAVVGATGEEGVPQVAGVSMAQRRSSW